MQVKKIENGKRGGEKKKKKIWFPDKPLGVRTVSQKELFVDIL